jgi:integrase
MVERADVEAKLGFKAHPHMLRHACGFALANKGERHAIFASLPRPQEYPTHCALHGHGASAVQEFLA